MDRVGRLVTVALMAPLLFGQRGKYSARDLFHSEAGLIVASDAARKGRFGSARKSTIAVTLGVKYRIWKLQGGQAIEADPAGPFQPGDQIRLGVETNDTGYLYIVHRQPSGLWRRVFPDPEIERGNHFIRSGLTYPIPHEEGIELRQLSPGERFFLVLSREPVKDLEVLVGPLRPEGTVSAAPPPEIPEQLVEKVRNSVNKQELATERVAPEKAVYAVNRSGKPESMVAIEVRLTAR